MLASKDFRADEILEITSSKHLDLAHEKIAAPTCMVSLKVLSYSVETKIYKQGLKSFDNKGSLNNI